MDSLAQDEGQVGYEVESDAGWRLCKAKAIKAGCRRNSGMKEFGKIGHLSPIGPSCQRVSTLSKNCF
jgi:hypothetical protein